MKIVKRKGFGLLEALIASGIIIMIATASIGLANVIVKSTTNFNQIIVADNLASEAIEVAHQMRDYSLNDEDANTSWSQRYQYDSTNVALLNCSLSDAVDSSKFGCYITTNTGLRSGYDNDTIFYFNNSLGINNNTITIGEGDKAMSFQRKIYIAKITDKDAYEMRVIVTRDGETLADVSTTLTNWK